jgi:hypothetical protein
MSDEKQGKMAVSQLRPEIQPSVALFGNTLLEDLGDTLESFSVVGSALTEDFDIRNSDINTVLVVKRRSHSLLQRLAGYGKNMGRQKLRAPLLMTREYIEQSLDVFGVEFLDFQLNHTTVYGPDPFADLRFRKEEVRLQCERELKSALIKLRQGYIQSLGKPKFVGELLIGCVSEFVFLLRAILWLQNQERPTGVLPTLKLASEILKFQPDSIQSLLILKQQHLLPAADSMEKLFENLYVTIDQITHQADQMRVEA